MMKMFVPVIPIVRITAGSGVYVRARVAPAARLT